MRGRNHSAWHCPGVLWRYQPNEWIGTFPRHAAPTNASLLIIMHAMGMAFRVSGSQAKAAPEGAPIDGGGKQDNGMRGETRVLLASAK